jgi:hypothetical protein
MKDLIEKAIDGWQDETERTAKGTVDGHDIRVLKREYKIEQRGPKAWKVAVYVDDDGPVATEQNKDLSATEAQEQFEDLVEDHNLTEE